MKLMWDCQSMRGKEARIDVCGIALLDIKYSCMTCAPHKYVRANQKHQVENWFLQAQSSILAGCSAASCTA